MLTMGTAAMLAFTLSPSAPACDAAGVQVDVLLEWRAHVVPETLQPVAQREVEAIWQRLGVPIRWLGDATERSTQLVSVSVVDDELLQQQGAVATPNLGWIEFRGTAPANMLYVSATGALETARRARTMERVMDGQPLAAARMVAARLVGRAIAHELGHYLLRSRKHTSGGLMRPVFPAAEGMIPLLDRYRLTRKQVDTLRDLMGRGSCR